jgi:hypothetical protein
MARSQSGHGDCATLVGLTLLMLAATLVSYSPAAVPLIDDWAYAWSVVHFLQTGTVRMVESSSHYPVAQILLGGALQPAVRLFLWRPAPVYSAPGVGRSSRVLLDATRIGNTPATGKPWHDSAPMQPRRFHARQLLHDRCPVPEHHERCPPVVCALGCTGAHARSRSRKWISGRRVPYPAARSDPRPRSCRLPRTDAPGRRHASRPPAVAAAFSARAVPWDRPHTSVMSWK